MASLSDQAEQLHKNLYSPKKDDIIVLDIAMNNNLKNRISIAQYYKSTFDKPVFEDIKSIIGGDFGYCAAQMFLSPLEFCIHHLKLGLSKSNDSACECVFEMLTSKTPEELKIIENAYKKETGKELKAEITKKFPGAIGKNILNLFDTQRKVNPSPRKNECENFANKLIKVDPKNWTEDENLFKEIFIERSPEELILIARYYLKNTGKNLLDDIKKKVKGKSLILLKEILYNNIMPHELFAEKINSAIKGLGTNEEILSRALVSRCELDMAAIREIYQYKYKVPMKDDIIGDTSDSYQKLCVYLGEK
jgi:hypothetical protein